MEGSQRCLTLGCTRAQTSLAACAPHSLAIREAFHAQYLPPGAARSEPHPARWWGRGVRSPIRRPVAPNGYGTGPMGAERLSAAQERSQRPSGGCGGGYRPIGGGVAADVQAVCPAESGGPTTISVRVSLCVNHPVRRFRPGVVIGQPIWTLVGRSF